MYFEGCTCLTLAHLAEIGNSRAKTTGLHMTLRRNFSGTVSATDPVKGSKHTASLRLHLKKIFCLEVRIFCEWRHKWRTFRPPWPTLPGPGANR